MAILWPAPIIELEQTTSTMDEAATLAADAQHLTCVVAAKQTKGRGRRGRYWMTLPDHSLALTIILKKEIKQLPLLAALAVAKTIEECDVKAQIKWPNDVLADSLKVAGVLIEKNRHGWLLGIGLNITTPSEGLPENFPGTTLEAVGAHTLDDKKVLQIVLNHVKETLNAGWNAQSEAYIGKCSTLGQKVRWQVSERKTVEGIAERLDKEGTLYINTGNEIFNVESGEIIHRN